MKYNNKSLVDAVGNLLAPEEGIRLVQAAVARLKAERGLEVLWGPGHCGLQGNELADEEAKLGSEEYQPLVRLDCATHRAVIRHACSTPFISTPPLTQQTSFFEKTSRCPSPT